MTKKQAKSHAQEICDKLPAGFIPVAYMPNQLELKESRPYWNGYAKSGHICVENRNSGNSYEPGNYRACVMSDESKVGVDGCGFYFRADSARGAVEWLISKCKQYIFSLSIAVDKYEGRI